MADMKILLKTMVQNYAFSPYPAKTRAVESLACGELGLYKGMGKRQLFYEKCVILHIKEYLNSINMNLDRTLSLYQAYSLTKVSALNKEMLKAQYAQCEQISKLEKSLSRELQAVNRIQQKILEEQIKGAKRLETLRYYKTLAHNLKEAIHIIDKQSDLVYKSFLLELFYKPLIYHLQDAKNNLEDISDKEFCSKWIEVLESNMELINSVQQLYNASPYHVMLEKHNEYDEEIGRLGEDLKKTKAELALLQRPTLEKIESKKSHGGIGCLITSILIAIYMIGAFIKSVVEDIRYFDVGVIVVAVVLPLCLVIWRLNAWRKKTALYPSYVAELESRNSDLQQQYDNELKALTTRISDIEDALSKTEHSHPYISAKQIVEQQPVERGEIVDKIDSLLPKPPQPKSLFNKQDLRKVAEKLVELGIPVSTAFIQRRYSFSYYRACKMLDELEKLGVVSEAKGSKYRTILIKASDLDHIFN